MKEMRRFELDPSTGEMRIQIGIGNVPGRDETDGGEIVAEMHTDWRGNGEYSTRGRVPQNEEYTSEPAAMVARALNARGESCSGLRRVEQDSERDFVADLANGGTVGFQVTRLHDQHYWKQWRTTGRVEGPTDAADAAATILQSSRNKAERYPSNAKRNVHLVIDATFSPQALAQTVREELQPRWREFAELGFAGTWLASPADTIRLDAVDSGRYAGPFRIVGSGSVAFRQTADE